MVSLYQGPTGILFYKKDYEPFSTTDSVIPITISDDENINDMHLEKWRLIAPSLTIFCPIIPYIVGIKISVLDLGRIEDLINCILETHNIMINDGSHINFGIGETYNIVNKEKKIMDNVNLLSEIGPRAFMDFRILSPSYVKRNEELMEWIVDHPSDGMCPEYKQWPWKFSDIDYVIDNSIVEVPQMDTHMEVVNPEKCVICMDKEPGTTVYPCKHKVVCGDCSHILQTVHNMNKDHCVVCRTKIDNIVYD